MGHRGSGFGPRDIQGTGTKPVEEREMTTGHVNPSFTLEKQGITGLGNVYYNLLEPAIMEGL